MPLADRALVVGINRYQGIKKLCGAENDAQNFFNWVTHPTGGGVDPGQATKILSSNFPAAASVNDDLPAKEQIERFFTEVDDAADANNVAGLGPKAGNRVWLFFSGHGFAPALDTSGVLMANATLKRIHNIAAMLWANRLYEGGWFDDVFLFQDACRNRIPNGDLTPPFLRKRQAPRNQQRRRFYAFSAKDQKLSVELPFPPPNGEKHGIFTRTLLQGLRDARDPRTGAVTTTQLKAYLQANMKNLLPEADKENDDFAQAPEVFDPDPPFDIVAAPAAPQVPQFPVRIFTAAGRAARVMDGTLANELASENPAPAEWVLRLQRGLYKLLVEGADARLFEVAGALEPDGSPREIQVR
ncbi:MAG: hypothetical protein JO084_06480 [Bradyrhizobiaceae bacterium]|nr:hypothetical protein [Hyphomicrobiales bacterium]MBV9427349.1 hypothetical protein [Bradyrhizobiaceae bacterium]